MRRVRVFFVFLLVLTFFWSCRVQAEGLRRDPASLETMLGAMLMCGFRGAELEPDDPFLELVRQGHVGHVILFDRDVQTGKSRNILSSAQVKKLTATLRQAKGSPMFIAIDQEGGQVSRLKPRLGFLALPSARQLGQGSPMGSRSWAQKSAAEMRRLGITLDFAPVADVADARTVIGRHERSFGPNAQNCAQHVMAFGQGLWDRGVIPTLKHFPGIGCATADTHLQSADIAHCFDQKRDLLPFTLALRSGWPGMVMVGHVKSSLDPSLPASLSPKVIMDVLRKRLGWHGVIITDDLQMRAISDSYSLEESIELAVQAGADILLFGNNLNWQEDLPQRAYAALQKLVADGRISHERIAASYARIQALLASQAKK
ncbi:MAG: glycoside hydrolase family 3 protein [Desulfovibrio sp.]|nr:glycoside hydrolase family 3 protein [Desulfovibrio sp.]